MQLFDFKWLHSLSGLMLFVFFTLPLSGCYSFVDVLPWEKGILAKPEMSFEDDKLEKGFKEHIYSSKESASGGLGVGGGGCGCN